MNENKEFWFAFDSFQYAGDIVNGVPHGRGTVKFTNGDVYEGDIENKLPHGRGTTKYAPKTPISSTLFLKMELEFKSIFILKFQIKKQILKI